MKWLESRPYTSIRHLACLSGAVWLGGCLFIAVLAHAATDVSVGPAWASPNVMALRHISPVAGAQHEPNFLNNLDCSLTDYRLVASKVMQTGCFTRTAYGLVDSDSDTAIFNDTDEGLPLLPYSPGQVLVPWPDTLGLLSLDAASTGGSYVSLYRNPLASLQDQRNGLLQLTAKRLTAPPDLPLKGPDGRQLVVNPQTMAFSGNGSWLVMETLGGSFVRINLATLDMTAFAPAFGSQGSPALLKSQVAVSGDGHYVAIGNNEASSLKVYDLTTCKGATAGLQPQSCDSHDYLPFVRPQITGFQSLRHLRFVNDGLLSFEAHTGDPAGDGIYELAPKDSITSLIDYLALGDSYTSGEGAFNYLSGTDTDSDMCHLSANSYPLLLTRDLFSNVSGHSVACSGAVINDIGSTGQSYRGQVKDAPTLEELQGVQSALLGSIMTNYLPGYVAQQRFVQQYQPNITTVSVGGNDIGFGDIVQKCVMPHVSLHSSDNDCYNTYEDRLEVTNLIDRAIPRWSALYKQLLAEAPGTRLYAIGYPQIVADTGNCAMNVHLSKNELEFSEELIDYLNKAIRQAATGAGVTYVDIGQALAGHRLCETASYNVAVNGLTGGTDGGVLGVRVLGKESYHPNALGQALIEQAILKQTHNLTLVTPVTNTDSGQQILAAPKTGRAVNIVVPSAGLAAGLVQAGKSTTVQVSGAASGSLKPKTTYTIKLDGPSGPVLSTVASGDAGDISTSVKLPNNTAPGSHTIDITGDNQAGEPLDVTQPIYIPVSDNDADGDGTPDVLDTCPGAVNSGQDSDRDGIDDTCDGFIGSQPAIPSSPSQTGGTDVHTSTNVSSGSNTTVSQSGGAIETPNNIEAGGLALSNQPLSIVTSFTIGNSKRAGSIGKQDKNNAPAVARALGSVTTSPSAIPGKFFRPPAKTKPSNSNRPFTSFRSIDWYWVLWIIIAWLVAIFCLCLGYLAEQSAESAYDLDQAR